MFLIIWIGWKTLVRLHQKRTVHNFFILPDYMTDLFVEILALKNLVVDIPWNFIFTNFFGDLIDYEPPKDLTVQVDLQKFRPRTPTAELPFSNKFSNTNANALSRVEIYPQTLQRVIQQTFEQISCQFWRSTWKIKNKMKTIQYPANSGVHGRSRAKWTQCNIQPILEYMGHQEQNGDNPISCQFWSTEEIKNKMDTPKKTKDQVKRTIW